MTGTSIMIRGRTQFLILPLFAFGVWWLFYLHSGAGNFLLVPFGAVVCFRAVRMGILASSKGLVVRGVWTDTQLNWTQVAAIEAVRAKRRTQLLTIRTTSGRVIMCGGTASMFPSEISRWLNKLNEIRSTS